MANPVAEVLHVIDTGTQIAPFTGRMPGFDLEAAYRVAADVATIRQTRGQRIAGRKIGFTNRTIWPIYDVAAPVWGWMYDDTIGDLPRDGTVALPALPEPRIEPEIAFGFATTPEPGMDMTDLIGCIDWIAHGFEIVVSIFPGWKFRAPDAAAGLGMHGALWLGPKIPLRDLLRDGTLADFSVTMTGPDETHHGQSRDVLDGPLHALGHLLDQIDRMPGAGPIRPGEIVTTGTLTDARPIAPGQVWHTTFQGLALPGGRIVFA